MVPLLCPSYSVGFTLSQNGAWYVIKIFRFRAAQWCMELITHFRYNQGLNLVSQGNCLE